MKKLIPIYFMFALVFIHCVGMEPKEQEMCCICREEFNYEIDDLIYIDGCKCCDSTDVPIIRVYHRPCFTDFYRHARYKGINVSCGYCSGVLSLQEEALCYLCPELLSSDSIEIYGCSCDKPRTGHRSCFKKGYCYAKCNNEEIICCDCKKTLALKEKKLISHENDVICSLCLESLKDESTIIQTYGCGCWKPRVYHNACYKDLSENARKCPACNNWLDYKAEVSLLHEGKQLSYEEITLKLKRNFKNNMKCEVIRGVGVLLLATLPFLAINNLMQHHNDTSFF